MENSKLTNKFSVFQLLLRKERSFIELKKNLNKLKRNSYAAMNTITLNGIMLSPNEKLLIELSSKHQDRSAEPSNESEI